MIDRLGLDGEYREAELPLLIRRAGMAEWTGDRVRILDRKHLPHDERYLDCLTVEDVARAIETMTIQGAFTLSIAAGYGLALATPDRPLANLDEQVDLAAQRLGRTRPTGLALKRMLAAASAAAKDAARAGSNPRQAVIDIADRAAAALARQALATARHANSLLRNGDEILTHCFADRSFVYTLLEARRTGKQLHVFCSETRPYLQGARLTAPSVLQAGHRATVISDGMGGFLMQQGRVAAFLTAADRVCLDGTICNKVGTYQYAVSARTNNTPYYVLRQSGPDPESHDAKDIHIEYRDEESMLSYNGTRTAPEGVRGLYPAFDITAGEFVRSIVTDRGVFAPGNIRDYFAAPPSVPDAVV
ncbi:MAG: S-methyl-5-thioribose-1-phosphate isomerase [Alphaproteobacteria bacterium]|nr:S-methyl-5-thioribose-1-phosphate isomerase [Alphaproteobacteria bacterium]